MLVLFKIRLKVEQVIKNIVYAFSRVILTYLTSAYSKDDTLYPRDVRMRALVDQRLQFDLGTLYTRLADYLVSINQNSNVSSCLHF